MSSLNEGNLADEQARAHLSVLSDVARIASASLSLDDALRRIMAAVSHQFAPENWSVLLADEDLGLRFGLGLGLRLKLRLGLWLGRIKFLFGFFGRELFLFLGGCRSWFLYGICKNWSYSGPFQVHR